LRWECNAPPCLPSAECASVQVHRTRPRRPLALRRTFQDLSDQSALVAHASTKLLVETAAVLALNCRDGALWRRLVHSQRRLGLPLRHASLRREARLGPARQGRPAATVSREADRAGAMLRAWPGGRYSPGWRDGAAVVAARCLVGDARAHVALLDRIPRAPLPARDPQLRACARPKGKKSPPWPAAPPAAASRCSSGHCTRVAARSAYSAARLSGCAPDAVERVVGSSGGCARGRAARPSSSGCMVSCAPATRRGCSLPRTPQGTHVGLPLEP
jgi:hypothetical protein